MKQAVQAKLEELRADFAKASGSPFRHFYCPVLYRDEHTELCRAHVINSAFQGSSSRWTIQRKDIDSFFGSLFESEFVTLQDRGAHKPIDVLISKHLSQRLKPQITLDDRKVEYYRTEDAPPPNHASLTIESGTIKRRFALKMTPSDTLAALDGKWEIRIEKDLRLPALVSLLKAAHLTLFEMLGYQYALTAAGHFLGRDILGRFFTENRSGQRKEVLQNARTHFREFVNLVRPLASSEIALAGTSDDNLLYLCTSGEFPWGMLVLIKAGNTTHGVLAPVFSHEDSAARYLAFLKEPQQRFTARLARFSGDHWEVSPDNRLIVWPDVDFD